MDVPTETLFRYSAGPKSSRPSRGKWFQSNRFSNEILTINRDPAFPLHYPVFTFPGKRMDMDEVNVGGVFDRPFNFSPDGNRKVAMSILLHKLNGDGWHPLLEAPFDADEIPSIPKSSSGRLSSQTTP